MSSNTVRLFTIPPFEGKQPPVRKILIGPGALGSIGECIRECKARHPYVLSDPDTFEAAGRTVCSLLQQEQINYTSYILPASHPEPDEATVGSAFMHCPAGCDLILGVGSGVINDTCKILSHLRGLPYIIAATAPSMDGYASATSSMSMDGLKVSLPSRCADIIVGDTDVLKKAPLHMLSSGIGDMIAKYVSIAEWHIAHLITGEYYSEEVAQLVRAALKKCTDHAEGLMQRDPSAVEAVFEGLIIGGVAMAYAGVSRPASGVEHYFSHVWDMRALQFGTFSDLHGIQCAMATWHAVRLYDALCRQAPDNKKAARYVAAFDYEDWKNQLRAFLGNSADTMIALEEKEGKYRKETHPARFARIEENWDAIRHILREELPSESSLSSLLKTVHISTDLTALQVDAECARMTFRATKDIRDKYVLSRLAWDLGVLEELCLLL